MLPRRAGDHDVKLLTAIIFSSTNEVEKIIAEILPMLTARIYSNDWDVEAKLRAFGVTRAELIEVVRYTLGERSNSVDVDPLGTPGQLSYIAGTRHLRWLFMSKGDAWKIDRTRNIESVVHKDKGIKVGFQNVDTAASIRDPRAISGKKSGTAKVIDDAQGSLFKNGELPEAVPVSTLNGLASSMWYLCVSFNGDEVCAELSLPASVKDGNFHGFLERIFLIQGGEWADFSIREGSDDEAIEFEPRIKRR